MELVPLLSFLSLWVGCTSAQEIRPGPGVVNVPEGDDALLPCALSSGQSIDEFDWRKDNGNEAKKEVFMYNKGSYYGDGKTKGQSQEFTNRVEFFQHELTSGNASIIIKNTRLEDNGTYTCGLGLFRHNRQEVHIRLNVDAVLTIRKVTGASPMPYIQTISDEITWRLLKCCAKGVPNPEVEWRNSAGKELAKHVPESEEAYFPIELNLNVTMSDNYTCVVTQRVIYHQINNTLPVRIPGAASEPFIDQIPVDNNGILLECKAQGVPKPEVEWRNSAGHSLLAEHHVTEHRDASGRFSVKVQVKVTSSDTYTCVVTQRDIYHQISRTVNVRIQDVYTGWIVAGVLGPLLLIIIIISIIIFKSAQRRMRQERPALASQPL